MQVQLLNVEYGFRNQQLPDIYSVKTESMALATTLDELGLKDALDFVAWSYGADVTLDFALEHPERVRTLVLIEPPKGHAPNIVSMDKFLEKLASFQNNSEGK